MIYALITTLLVLLVYGPSLWVRWVMWRYSHQIETMPGTGGELARHLIKRFQLEDVKVETTEQGDHYDPAERTVRLSRENHDGKSLSAIAVAAHEIGHAIQFARNEPVSQLRQKYLVKAINIRRLGIGLLMFLPIIAAIVRVPHMILLNAVVGVITMLVSAFMYLFILPEELDASFNKALPILIEGEYISDAQIPAVKRILRAAAFTYFAGALADVLSLWRWLLLLRGARI